MKDFLLICDKNCATYKEVFPLFKQGIVSFSSPDQQKRAVPGGQKLTAPDPPPRET